MPNKGRFKAIILQKNIIICCISSGTAVQNDLQWERTFACRKRTIMLKASQLAKLTNSVVTVTIKTPCGDMYYYASNEPAKTMLLRSGIVNNRSMRVMDSSLKNGVVEAGVKETPNSEKRCHSEPKEKFLTKCLRKNQPPSTKYFCDRRGSKSFLSTKNVEQSSTNDKTIGVNNNKTKNTDNATTQDCNQTYTKISIVDEDELKSQIDEVIPKPDVKFEKPEVNPYMQNWNLERSSISSTDSSDDSDSSSDSQKKEEVKRTAQVPNHKHFRGTHNQKPLGCNGNPKSRGCRRKSNFQFGRRTPYQNQTYHTPQNYRNQPPQKRPYWYPLPNFKNRKQTNNKKQFARNLRFSNLPFSYDFNFR